MVSFKRYLALSFMFVGFMFLSSIILAVTFGYDTAAQCKRFCPAGTCSLDNSTGKYLCGLLGCTSGQVQYKPSGSCGTSSRKCCSNGKWSDWDAECDGASSCTANQCWNGTKCEDKGAVSSACADVIPNTVEGDVTRTAKCVSGSGWQYGEWDGECWCADGYMPDEDSSLTCHQARYDWKILNTEKTNITEMCEDATYSDTYLWKQLYGINDAESIIGTSCKLWLDHYGELVWFNIWRNGETCYRYQMKCVKS